MIQNGFYVSIRKTEIIKVSDRSNPLPPDLGPFKEYKVADYFCPNEWGKDSVFIQVKENEPMWFDFTKNDECAVLCSVQKVNPVTGEPSDFEKGLSKHECQNYLKLPNQRWLDGYSKDGKVYQFVATKEESGLAVNKFVLPKNMQDSHAIGFAFYPPKNPKPKLKPRSKEISFNQITYLSSSKGSAGGDGGAGAADDSNPQRIIHTNSVIRSVGSTKISSPVALGPTASMKSTASNQDICYSTMSFGESDVDLGSENKCLIDLCEEKIYEKASMSMGGRIAQKIYQDENTVEYYTEKPAAVLVIHLCSTEQFDSIMKKGLRQNSEIKDKYTYSGELSGIQIPLNTTA